MVNTPVFSSSVSDASFDPESGKQPLYAPVAYAQPVMQPQSASAYSVGPQPAAIGNQAGPVMQVVDPATGRTICKRADDPPMKFSTAQRWLWYVVAILVFTTTIVPVVAWMSLFIYMRSTETIPESITKVLPWLQSDWDIYRKDTSFTGGLMAFLCTIMAVFTLGLVMFGVVGFTYRVCSQKICSSSTSSFRRAMVFIFMWSIVWSVMSMFQFKAAKSSIAQQVIANFVLFAFGRFFSDWRIATVIGAVVRALVNLLIQEIGMAIRKYSSTKDVPASEVGFFTAADIVIATHELADKVGFPKDKIYFSKAIGSSHCRSIFQNDIVIQYHSGNTKITTEHYAGVFAHELGHWVNDDVVWMLVSSAAVAVVTGALPFMLSALPAGIVELAASGLNVKTALAIPDAASRVAVSIAMSDVINTSFKAFIDPLLLMDSRRVEYRADRHAVEMGYGQAIYEYLAMNAQNGEATVPLMYKAAFSTHPPKDERLDAIRVEMEAKDQKFTMLPRSLATDKLKE